MHQKGERQYVFFLGRVTKQIDASEINDSQAVQRFYDRAKTIQS
jgi:hypothetical protein